MKEHMKEQGVNDGFQNLNLHMWTNPSAHSTAYPKLKGKAKELKEFAGTLSWYWTRSMNQEDMG